MSAKGHGRRGGHHEEEHENHERWLVSYADMLTVLMALFIVLFAISQVDAQKFLELKSGMADGFGASSTIPVAGGSGLLDTNGTTPNPAQLDLAALPQPVDLSNPVQGATDDGGLSQGQAQQATAAAAAELDDLSEVQGRLEAALAAQGLSDRVRFRVTERGLVAAVVADDVFFASGSADLEPTGRRVLQAVSPVIAGLDRAVDVDGHANHLQISTARFPSNWELSAGRAAVVVRTLVSDGVAPTRLSATGYGDTQPLYPQDDPRALSGNRRVDLVVLSDQPALVRDLLPQLAAARGLDTTGAHPTGESTLQPADEPAAATPGTPATTGTATAATTPATTPATTDAAHAGGGDH